MTKSIAPIEVLPVDAQDGRALPRLVEVMRALLAEDGCPWDREQTLQSLRRYVLEEACEVMDAIDAGNPKEHCEELGDLLLQIVFQSELTRGKAEFAIDDVVKGICDKLIRRHPHVFGGTEIADSAEVLRQWEELKAREKAARAATDGGFKGILSGLPKSLPALSRAERMGAKVATVGFDWPDRKGSRAKVDEELKEFDEACLTGDPDRMALELGDTFFALVNLARHHKIDPEAALRATMAKFERRFSHVEKRVVERYGSFEGRPRGLEELDALWEEAKKDEAARALEESAGPA